jgi:hypothetical protein
VVGTIAATAVGAVAGYSLTRCATNAEARLQRGTFVFYFTCVQTNFPDLLMSETNVSPHHVISCVTFSSCFLSDSQQNQVRIDATNISCSDCKREYNTVDRSPEFCPVLTLFARAACKVESCVRIMAAAIVLPVHVLSLLLTEVLQMLL